MKKYSLLLCALFASTLGACGHFPIINTALTNPTAKNGKTPPELQAFLDEATTAAKQIEKEDNLEEWKSEYEKVKKLYDEIPRDALRPSVQKDCDDIINQMLLGKLAIGLKKDDAYAGKKRCLDASVEIMRIVKDVKTANSKKK